MQIEATLPVKFNPPETIIVRLFQGYHKENDHLWTNQLGNRTTTPLDIGTIMTQVLADVLALGTNPDTVILSFSNGGSPLAHPVIRNNWEAFARAIEAFLIEHSSILTVKFHMTIVGTDIYDLDSDGAATGGISDLPCAPGYIPDITYLTMAADEATRNIWIPGAAPIGDILNLLSSHKLKGAHVNLAVPMILGHTDDMNHFGRLLAQSKAVNIKDLVIRDFHSHDESYWTSVDMIDKEGARDFAISRGWTATIEGVEG